MRKHGIARGDPSTGQVRWSSNLDHQIGYVLVPARDKMPDLKVMLCVSYVGDLVDGLRPVKSQAFVQSQGATILCGDF